MNLRPERATRTSWRISFALIVVVVLMAPQFVEAATYDEISQSVDFQAISGADEVQNNLDEGSATNYDSWDPIPQGVFYGGWPVESRLRLSDVPDTNYEVAMATVCKFSADIIMSGAARTLVRLPVHTGVDPWTSARLNIYAIANGTDWTFDKIDAADYPPGGLGYEIDKMKINFTSGSHELVFWSTDYDPTDTSPTDGNDHFSRSNRTYVFVDAPLHPDIYYLFVTYVWYASDKYVDCYIQPDSLDIDGRWNRSDVCRYNEEAPDSYNLEWDVFNVSFGYSFDFRNGFGNSAYGLNEWMDAGDEVKYFAYVNLSNNSVEDDDYISIMVPFKTTTHNTSFDVSIYVYNVATGGFSLIYYWPGRIYNDFILVSMDDDWGTNKSALGFEPNGWFYVKLTINNNTRLRLPLWDLNPWTRSNGINQSWNGTIIGNIWESNEYLSYNLLQWCQLNHGGLYYNYHWEIQNSFQFNNFRWDKTVPASSGSYERVSFSEMSFGDKILWSVGQVLYGAGTLVGMIPLDYAAGVGLALRSAGTIISLKARAGLISEWAGRVWDAIMKVGDFFYRIGQWVWRAAQAIIGAISWFIETITYFTSIILGLLLFVIALVILFVPLWFSAKFGQIIVLALRGRQAAAVAEMGNIAMTAKGMVPRRGGS